MENLKIFGSLFLAMLRCFILGAYATNTFNSIQTIEPHRWFMTILFGLFFLANFLIEYRKR